MYRTKNGILAVEFKSRKGRVFSSDIVQAKCASLAARGAGYKVIEILVKTAREERYITLPRSDTDLFHEIQPKVAMARKAKRGDQVPSFQKGINAYRALIIVAVSQPLHGKHRDASKHKRPMIGR